MSSLFAVEAIGLSKAKVGLTRDPERRIETIRRMCPVPIEVLGVRSATQHDEEVVLAELDEFMDENGWVLLTERAREVINRSLREPRVNFVVVNSRVVSD